MSIAPAESSRNSRRRAAETVISHGAEAVTHHKRLLLAEDDPINQMACKTIMQKLGYSCDVVNNGVEALKALAERPYDLVLMDCMMPEMDGFETTAVIRAPESNVLNHAVPVIALTARTVAGDHEACLAAGMSDYLKKPLRSHDLKQMLDKWLPDSPADDGNQPECEICQHEQFTDDKEVIALFIAKAPGYVTAMGNSVCEGNAPEIQRHAHRLAGAAQAIGAITCAGLVSEMEQYGKSNNPIMVAQKMHYLSEAFTELLTALKQRSCK